MRKNLFILSICLLLSCRPAGAQESISASPLEGCDSLQVTFTLENAMPEESYSSIHWDFDDGGSASGSLVVQHTYTTPGTYTARCMLDGSQTVIATNPVTLGQTPATGFIFRDSSESTQDLRYFFASSFSNGTTGNSYIWSFPGGETAFDSTAFHTFSTAGVYEIMHVVIDPYGCSDTLIKEIPVSAELMAANVFTPNDDGVNDFFRVTTPDTYTYMFRVFTRNGIQVHYTESPRVFWDGRSSSGMIMPEGVYYYVIESIDAPEKITLSGFLHLYR